jgi:hypothetical protein
MSDVGEQGVTPDKEVIIAAFSELMGHIRKQDELVHSWTKYYLTIQAGLAIALAFLVRLGPTEGVLINAGSLFIPFLGIITAICLTNIIIREQMWQGRYIAQLTQLPLLPEVYKLEWAPSEPDPHKRGYIANQFHLLRNVIIGGWLIWLIVTIIRILNILPCSNT